MNISKTTILTLFMLVVFPTTILAADKKVAAEIEAMKVILTSADEAFYKHYMPGETATVELRGRVVSLIPNSLNSLDQGGSRIYLDSAIESVKQVDKAYIAVYESYSGYSLQDQLDLIKDWKTASKALITVQLGYEASQKKGGPQSTWAEHMSRFVNQLSYSRKSGSTVVFHELSLAWSMHNLTDVLEHIPKEEFLENPDVHLQLIKVLNFLLTTDHIKDNTEDVRLFLQSLYKKVEFSDYMRLLTIGSLIKHKMTSNPLEYKAELLSLLESLKVNGIMKKDVFDAHEELVRITGGSKPQELKGRLSPLNFAQMFMYIAGPLSYSFPEIAQMYRNMSIQVKPIPELGKLTSQLNSTANVLSFQRGCYHFFKFNRPRR